MKKITSLILVLAMLVSVFSFGTFAVYADGEDSTVDLKNQHTIQILKTLGIADSFLASYSEAATMTRRQFCIMMKDFLGKSFGSTTNLIPFDDVMDYDPDIAVLRTMTELGLMYGFDDNTFRPDAEVTYEDAITVMVNMLGYTLPAESKGGYPMGYLAVAAQQGLVEGITPVSGKAITHADILTLLSNFIEIDVLEQVSFGDEGKFQAIENETILAKRFNVYKGDGIVNGTDESKLDMSSTIVEGRVQIGDSILYINDTNAKDYFGYNVDYYYELNKTGISKLIAIFPNEYNKEVVIDVADKGELNGNVLSYYVDGSNKIYDIKIPVGLVTVYNGVASAFDRQKIDEMQEGYITFVDNNGDKKYDVLFVNEVKYIVVKNTNKSTNVIYGKFNDDMIVLEDDSFEDIKYKIFDASGKETDLSAIKEWDIISVTSAVIEGVKVVKIRIVSNAVTGKLEGLSGESGNYDYVIVNGTEYKVSNTMNKLIEDGKIDDFELGKEITLLLNEKNNVVVTKDVEASFSGKLGYLRDHYALDISGSNYCLEFVDDSGTIKEVNFAPEFKFLYADYRGDDLGNIVEYDSNIKLDYKMSDGEVIYKGDFDEFIDCLKNCISERRFVFRYDVDAEGKINEIELAAKATVNKDLLKKNRLSLIHETSDKYRVYKTALLEWKKKNEDGKEIDVFYTTGKNYSLASSATLFGTPLNPTGDDSDEYVINSDFSSIILANSSDSTTVASNVAINDGKFYTYGVNEREFVAGSYPSSKTDLYLSTYTVASDIFFVSKVSTSAEEIDGEKESIIKLEGIMGLGGNSSLKIRDLRDASEKTDNPLKFTVGDIIIAKKGSDGYCTFKNDDAVNAMDSGYDKTGFINNSVPILRILKNVQKGNDTYRGRFTKTGNINMIANSGRHGLLSYVVDISDGLIYTSSFDDFEVNDESTKYNAPKLYNIGKEKVFIFDSKKGEVRKGTLDDIITIDAGMPEERGSAHLHTQATVVYAVANLSNMETLFVFK